MKKFLDFIDTISEWTGKIFSWLIVVLTILVVLEVILRRFFNSPTIWNFEVSLQIYAFHFLILCAFTLLHKAHVSIDIFYQKLRGRSKALLDVITYAMFFFPFLLVVLHQGTKYALSSWALGERTWSAFSPPIYPIKTMIPIMALLLLIQGIAIFIRKLNIAIKGEEL